MANWPSLLCVTALIAQLQHLLVTPLVTTENTGASFHFSWEHALNYILELFTINILVTS